jgi:hypothetical protein
VKLLGGGLRNTCWREDFQIFVIAINSICTFGKEDENKKHDTPQLPSTNLKQGLRTIKKKLIPPLQSQQNYLLILSICDMARNWKLGYFNTFKALCN